ncbi:MAG: FHA domain-containing protein, partial [Anaerolineales bacterium]
VLKDLAIQTGGQSFQFSGAEQLPGLDAYLAPLRHTYQLEYSSSILTSGSHTLAVQVTLNGEPVTSADIPFELDVQPPNPILVAPPQQIVRTAPDARTTAPALFIPTQQKISIIIEFPDKRTRPLVQTVLYVDGIQAAENTSAPFDQFTWDLKGYITSAPHILTVKAVDSYGLSKVSLGVPVLVTIVKPQFGLLPWLFRNSQWVSLGAIFFAGGGLVVILARSRVRNRRKTPTGRKSHLDPLTQPVHPEMKKGGLRPARKPPVKNSEAYLVRLKDDGQPITAPPIPITSAEVIFGSDPIQATYILDDPSVSPRHARLKEKDGEYILSDEKSVAGTWINYEQLIGPHSLGHGDVIHIGRMSYRFMLRKPPELPTLRVTPTKK